MHAQASRRGKSAAADAAKRAERRGKVDAEAVRKRAMARMEQGNAFRIVSELKTIQKEIRMWDAARSSEGGETDDGDDDDGPAPGANQLAWLKVGESRGGRRERARARAHSPSSLFSLLIKTRARRS